MAFEHISVLKNEVLENLTFNTSAPARLIDGTLGGGGHSFALLEKYPHLELLGIDRDENALDAASERLKVFGSRFTAVKGCYSELAALAAEHGWNEVDGVLLDIGVSSPQIDTAERGFSWRENGPLDMRMDQTSPLTAARLLNRTSEEELGKIFRNYGELKFWRKLAAAVVARREEAPFAETSDLVKLCDDVLGKARKGELPRPTLVFQALRIAVNDELGELERGLNAAHDILKTGGRLAVISFHSLEDRIVKNFMRDAAKDCVCPPGLPVCCCNHRATLKLVTRHALTAAKSELEQNRRSAPAKLRVAEKC
ncbi:MAG: 16S rRNA (cytosine(1402)-N(4))-methyltransferase RsmH [Lentisphaerae bacterium]|nr:16S rRNA (cytosine(1402)-N(4))-methyltransferase RsmH [Lentisphaerota bacterium]